MIYVDSRTMALSSEDCAAPTRFELARKYTRPRTYISECSGKHDTGDSNVGIQCE